MFIEIGWNYSQYNLPLSFLHCSCFYFSAREEKWEFWLFLKEAYDGEVIQDMFVIEIGHM